MASTEGSSSGDPHSLGDGEPSGAHGGAPVLGAGEQEDGNPAVAGAPVYGSAGSCDRPACAGRSVPRAVTTSGLEQRGSHRSNAATPLADRILAIAGEGMPQDTRRRLERWLAKRGVSLEDLEERASWAERGEESELAWAGGTESSAAASALGATGAL